MKRLASTVIILLIFAIFLTALTGCICCVCPPQEEEITHPLILLIMYFCELLEKARIWAPMANYRWMMSEFYELCSKSDIEWALSQIGALEHYMSYDEVTDQIHGLPGYGEVPCGYVELQDGTIRNIVVCVEEGEVRAYLFIDRKLEQLTSNSDITKMVI